MVRIKEEPLTVQALNAFFKTIHKELERSSGSDREMKEHINVDVAGATLHFVGTSWKIDPKSTLPALRGGNAPPEEMMPTTMSELRARMEAAREQLVMRDDAATESAKAILTEISAKALRAAEREMSKTSTRSR